MSKIIDRAGSGIPITPVENDVNLDSLHGINQVIAGATHTVDITDQGDTLEFTNAGAVAVTLDSIATIQGAAHTSDFHVILIATNAATVATITPNGANSFNTGAATIVLTVDEYVILETDSTGLIWNVITSSDALKVGGLSASQFLRSDANDTATGDLTFSGNVGLDSTWDIAGTAVTVTAAEINDLVDKSSAQTISGAKTFTENILLEKASPQLFLKCADEATENTNLLFYDELGVIRALIYRPAGTDKLRLDARNSAGVVQAALELTESGDVIVTGGTFKATNASLTTPTMASPVINTGVSGTAGVSRMIQETVIATTSGTTADFTVPSWAKKITIMADSVSWAATAVPLVQIGDAGGIEITGYVCVAGSIQTAGTGFSTVTDGFFVGQSTTAGNNTHNQLTLTNLTGNLWQAVSSGRAGNAVIAFSFGDKTLSGALTTIRYTSQTGATFDAGQVNAIFEG